MSKLDHILEDTLGAVDADAVKQLAPVAKQQIKALFLELVGEDNEHHKDMPVPDPDPFALPQDHQNQLRRYLRKKVESL